MSPDSFARRRRRVLRWKVGSGGGQGFRYARVGSGSNDEENGIMTQNTFSRGPAHLEKKPVRVRLRGGRSLEGVIHIPEGLSLLHFLGTKKYFLNLTSVRFSDAPESQTTIDHLGLRLSNVVWIIPQEGTLHVSSASVPMESSRAVEIGLVDGVVLAVRLHISEEQRMSDYLDANWAFLPLWSARLAATSETIERMAVNHEAILSIREVEEI